MPRRIDAGDVLAALGALLVLIALFLDWFEGGDRGANGWEAFEALDLVLAGLALAVLAAAAAGAGLLHSPSPRLLAPLGLAIVAIVAVQLIQPPPVFLGAEPDLGEGAWLALAGGLLVLLGGLLRVARVSVSVSVGGRDVRRRVAAVDRRPGADAGVLAGAPAREEAVRFGAPAAATDVPEGDPQPTQPFSALEDR